MKMRTCKTVRHAVLVVLCWICVAQSLAGEAVSPRFDPPAAFDVAQRAARHDIVFDLPACRFFEGGLIGNGAMATVVRTRPDAVLLHFGHQNVWDIRYEVPPMEKLGTFRQFWQQWLKKEKGDAAAAQWVNAYAAMGYAGYQKPYPRPWPCGTLVLAFEQRDMEPLGHRVRLADGVCVVTFRRPNARRLRLEIIPDRQADRLWLRVVDEAGKPAPAFFTRVNLVPDTSLPVEGFPASGERLAFRQKLPQLPSNPAGDEAVRVTVRHRLLQQGEPPVACVQIDHGLDKDLPHQAADVPPPTGQLAQAAQTAAAADWKSFWSRSGVALSDEYLERSWYRNLYFHHCVSRAGARLPGFTCNWLFGSIGTSWHSDYHLNYNTQQALWGVFSCNHVDLHLPYVELIRAWRPTHQAWARNFYELPGEMYGLSLYPIVSKTPPYPVPGLSLEICMTPWAVQSLWWHYLYTKDEAFLRDQAFEPLRGVVAFLNAYMRRPEAHGPTSPWKDDKFHIYPTHAPEIHGLFSDPGYNDCLVDLTLTKFVFKAYRAACRVLGREEQEKTLMAEVGEVLAHFPAYAVADHPRGGKVFKDVAAASPETIYNTPNTLMPVFPGEEIGLHSSPDELAIARNTYRQHRNEGGNELVFVAAAGVRLGVLDLEKWKRELRYCELPNGSFALLNLQAGGRVHEMMDFDWMARMGIVFENFSIPFVINECLLQSYTGELRLMPNWTRANGNARFQTLRAVGAFLVSGEIAHGEVQWLSVTAEKGGKLRLLNPWQGQTVQVIRCDQTVRRPYVAANNILAGERLEIDLQPRERIVLRQNTR
jgi:alpha-L-fucosidase 2